MNRRISRVTGSILAGVLLIGGPASGIHATPFAGIATAMVPQVTNTVRGGPSAGISLAVSEYLAQDSSKVAGVSENDAPVVAAEDDAAEEASVAARDDLADAQTGDVSSGMDAPADVDEPSGEPGAEQATGSETSQTQFEYADIAIAQVDNYVNIRSEPNTESEVLGKLYDNSAATILAVTPDGWYRITSGSVTGYVKCEYVVAGDEELARAVSTRYAKVTTTTLYVRMEPSTDAGVLTMVPIDDDLVVLDESVPGWVKVSTEEGDGYVSTDYVTLTTEFVQAESREEEAARLAKEEAERQAAAAAAEAARRRAAQASQAQSSQSNSSSGASDQTYTAPTSSNGQAVVNYACQFVGNPYVYGGTSLTNGTDCSGFVMSVYAAFGISLPHSSSAMRGYGYEVSLSQAQPGDIVCYSGHVGIYVGNGTIVHASTPSSGITYSSVNYRSPICVRRIF